MPSPMLWSTDAVCARGAPAVRMREVANDEKRYAPAWSTSAAPTPPMPISAPPSAGPTMRMVFEPSELTATAFARSSAPTTSYTITWRAGWLTLSARPSSVAVQYSIQTLITWVMTSAASTTATQELTAVMTTSTERRLKRSVIAPAKGETVTVVTPRMNEMAPIWNGECVSSKMSQPWATNCTHWPSMVPTLPAQSTRKSGY